MKDQYKLTAVGWANSRDPPILAAALKKIQHFAATGPPHELLQTGFHELFKKGGETLEDCGLNLLSYLVSNRWADLSDNDKKSLFQIMPKTITAAAGKTSWSTKNKAAILLSRLIAKDPVTVWEKLVAACMDCHSYDEIQAESSIVTCLLEGISIPGDGLKDQRTKDMKIENWDWLLETLFFLVKKHVQMINAAPSDQQRYDLILCIANTACAYAPLDEVKNLVKGVNGTDLIESCKLLLLQEDFLSAGFAYMSEICSRLQPSDCDEDILIHIFSTLFDLWGTKYMAAQKVEFRESVYKLLVIVKEALGVDWFQYIREGYLDLLEDFKAEGRVPYADYAILAGNLLESMLID